MLHGQSQKKLYLSGLPWLRLCTSAAGGVGATCCMASPPKERKTKGVSLENQTLPGRKTKPLRFQGLFVKR